MKVRTLWISLNVDTLHLTSISFTLVHFPRQWSAGSSRGPSRRRTGLQDITQKFRGGLRILPQLCDSVHQVRNIAFEVVRLRLLQGASHNLGVAHPLADVGEQTFGPLEQSLPSLIQGKTVESTTSGPNMSAWSHRNSHGTGGDNVRIPLPSLRLAGDMLLRQISWTMQKVLNAP